MVYAPPDNDQHALARLETAWQTKPVLRRIYKEQFYRRLLAHTLPGAPILEIGSGMGHIREVDPSIWRSDILPSDGIHAVLDVHELPFAPNTFGSIIGLDVLHHFNTPLHFLKEAARVIRPGGRLVMIEPWITPFSRFVYTYLHQEDCDMQAQPWREDEQFAEGKLAFDGNPALPYLLIEHGKTQMTAAVPSLRLRSVERFSSLTYLLSMGFKPNSFLPNAAYPLLYGIEEVTRPLWSPLAALRAMIVWEKI